MQNTNQIELAQYVRSKAGRDRDRIFLIFEIIDENYVYIVDGDLRRLENPKKKKIKHLEKIKRVSERLKNSIEQGQKINNAFVRKEIEQIRPSGLQTHGREMS